MGHEERKTVMQNFSVGTIKHLDSILKESMDKYDLPSKKTIKRWKRSLKNKACLNFTLLEKGERWLI